MSSFWATGFPRLAAFAHHMKQISYFLSRRINQNTDQIVSISIAIIYLWFGALKFFSGLSPAEQLAQNTISELTFNLIPADIAILLLAFWEVAIRVLLIGNLFKRTVLFLALLHILLTFTPFIFFPDLVFTEVPFGLTLLGQYIIKNLIILGVLLVLIGRRKQF